MWLRGVDLNHRPLGYEPNELPDCSTPHEKNNSVVERGQTGRRSIVGFLSRKSRKPIICTR